MKSKPEVYRKDRINDILLTKPCPVPVNYIIFPLLFVNHWRRIASERNGKVL